MNQENKTVIMHLNLEEIIKKLSESFNSCQAPENPYKDYLNRLQPRKKLKRAAVLIPFLMENCEWHILFIRRTQKSEDLHSGQVAFPGGHCDRNDPDPIHAAFREMFEETGVAMDDIQYLGRLRDLITTTGFRITPIVGAIPWPYPLRPQPTEVSRIFSIPLKWLIDPTKRNTEYRIRPKSDQAFPVIYYEPYDGEILWGASARITHLLLEALGFANSNDRYEN